MNKSERYFINNYISKAVNEAVESFFQKATYNRDYDTVMYILGYNQLSEGKGDLVGRFKKAISKGLVTTSVLASLLSSGNLSASETAAVKNIAAKNGIEISNKIPGTINYTFYLQAKNPYEALKITAINMGIYNIEKYLSKNGQDDIKILGAKVIGTKKIRNTDDLKEYIENVSEKEINFSERLDTYVVTLEIKIGGIDKFSGKTMNFDPYKLNGKFTGTEFKGIYY